MSKRSYRRLAAVAGAALAVGSMAPAMAIRIGSEDAANVGIETVDINDVTSLLPLGSQDLGGLGLGLVTDVAGSVLATATGLPAVAVPAALGLADAALCIPTGIVGTALDLDLTALAGLHIGLGGIGAGAGLTGLFDLPFAAVGTVTNCAFGLVDGALDTVGTVRTVATPVVTAGLGVVAGVTATATSVPGIVLGLPGGLMGLGDLLSLTASGNASLGAALVGIL